MSENTFVRHFTPLPSCPIHVERGYIEGNSYEFFGSRYRLSTLSYSKVITLPYKIEQSGPAMVSSSICSSFIFLDIPVSRLWYYAACLLFLILLLVPACYRMTKLRKSLKSFDCKLRFSFKGLKVSTPSGEREIKFLQLILYLYFLSSSYVSSCADVAHFIGNNSFFVASLWTNDEICTQGGSIRLPDTVAVLDTVYDYDTYISWSHERKENWGCGGGACPSIEGCEDIENSVPTFKDDKLTKKFCKMYPKACTFSRGCWMGEDIITFKRKFEVHTFVVWDNLMLQRIHNSECNILISNRQDLNLDNFAVLINDDGEYYFCKNINHRGASMKTFIGDNQLVNEQFIFPWNAINCDENWFKSSKCFYDKHLPIEQICYQFPAIINGVKFEYFNDKVKATSMSNNLLVVGSCESEFISKHSECFNTKIELHGRRESGYGIFLTVISYSKGNSSTIISLPCVHNYSFHIRCDGTLNYFPITETHDCNNLLDLTENPTNFKEFIVNLHDNSILESLNADDNVHAYYIIIFLGFLLFLQLIHICFLH